MTGQRSSNLDFLRCLAMFLIVLGHFFTHGCGESVNSRFDVKSMTSVTVLGVDLFFLLSGYFSLTNNRIKWSKLVLVVTESKFERLFFRGTLWGLCPQTPGVFLGMALPA